MYRYYQRLGSMWYSTPEGGFAFYSQHNGKIGASGINCGTDSFGTLLANSKTFKIATEVASD